MAGGRALREINTPLPDADEMRGRRGAVRGA
jgi:hypothetical protein